jgi:hypothetical protein
VRDRHLFGESEARCHEDDNRHVPCKDVARHFRNAEAVLVRDQHLKLEAVVKLGIANSRMKDFHDLDTLSRTFEFNGPTLAQAIHATFKNDKPNCHRPACHSASLRNSMKIRIGTNSSARSE